MTPHDFTDFCALLIGVILFGYVLYLAIHIEPEESWIDKIENETIRDEND